MRRQLRHPAPIAAIGSRGPAGRIWMIVLALSVITNSLLSIACAVHDAEASAPTHLAAAVSVASMDDAPVELAGDCDWCAAIFGAGHCCVHGVAPISSAIAVVALFAPAEPPTRIATLVVQQVAFEVFRPPIRA